MRLAAAVAHSFKIGRTGLCLNMLIAWALERIDVHYLMIGLTVLIVAPMSNFIGHRLITFGQHSGASHEFATRCLPAGASRASLALNPARTQPSRSC